MSRNQETKKKGGPQGRVLFIENPHLKAIEDLLKNCIKYKEELQLDKELDEACNEYQDLLKRAKRPGFKKTTPPYELNLFNDERRSQAPSLYDVISIVSKKCPHTHWKKAVSEFIGLTPIQTEPMQPKEQDKQPVNEQFRPQAEKADVPTIPSEGGDLYQRKFEKSEKSNPDVDEETTKDDGESERSKPVQSDQEEKADEEQEDSENKDKLSETLPPGENPDTEDQSLKNEGDKEEDKEEEVFHDAVDVETKDKAELVNVRFKVFPKQQPIAVFLQNCQCFKEELQLGEELDEAVNEYDRLLKKAKETGCPALMNAPPSQLNAVTPKARCQAPCLYEVISDVSKRCPKAKWMDAVTEFITLTTYSQSEPRHAQHQRPRSASGYQKKKEKVYRNAIEKLLDQEWDSEFVPKTAVEYDYRHFYTSESVLRSSFPDAYIFNMASSTLSKPEDVPPEFRERTLFNFLLSIDMKKYGVNPDDAWRDFGRCVLAEKQLDLARRAVGPDLDKNVIVDKKTFYKIQNELQEKTQEIEELSTRLSKFASQQLTEGNPNIADLSDTHRPTRLGEMYSQLFDDEWSEAFEAFKPKKGEEEEEEDDDIFPDTLFILQNMLKEIFEFCKNQSQKQLIDLEDNFATVIGLKERKARKQKEEKRVEENQTDGEEKSSEQPKMPDESKEEKGTSAEEEIKDTGDTSDNKGDNETAPEDTTKGDELLQEPKVSTESMEKDEKSMEKDEIIGESSDNQTHKETPENIDSAKGDSDKDLGKEEGADEQPKPLEEDQSNEEKKNEDKETNSQDTTVTDPAPNREPEKDTSNNISNDTDVNKNMDLKDQPKEAPEETLEVEQNSEDKTVDPYESRSELSNEDTNNQTQTSEDKTEEKIDDKASTDGQDTKAELLEDSKTTIQSAEQSNMQQSADKEASDSKDGEKKEEVEEGPEKAPEEEEGQGNGPKGEEGQGNGPKGEEGQGNGPKEEEGQGDRPKEEEGQGNGPKEEEGQGDGPKEEEGQGDRPKEEEGQGNGPKEEEGQGNGPKEEEGQGDRPKGKEEQEKESEEEEEEDRKYRTDPAFPMIERHAREFRKSAAATSARTKSKLFINVELPNLVMDESIREDLRTLTYVRKCVELCWYMCMQDPPMVIISPEKGQDIDKGLFSLHGRRGKTVEVCVWPALLLHDNGPLVCKGYVLPEERKRKK